MFASGALEGGDGASVIPEHAANVFDPSTGRSTHTMADVMVSAPRAMHADALATAIYVAGEDRAPALLAAYPGARAIVMRGDGTAIRLG
jgi:FAD:protein FMN transferase